jgi:hypothetical protein
LPRVLPEQNEKQTKGERLKWAYEIN